MSQIAVLMTVYNRKLITLRCLEFLYKSILKINNCSFDIYVTDDKSTDGTSEAIRELYPSISITPSDGELYWNRGMILAWEFASKNKKYDFFIWLNDDTILFEESLSILLESSYLLNNTSIISGAIRSEYENVVTYGGLVNDNMLIPNGKLQEFELLNGNFVIIPKFVFEKVGMLDKFFHHGNGDHDYGFRAINKGIKLYLTPTYIGYCERHDNIILKCYNYKISLIERFKFLYSPLGPNPLINYFYYLKYFSFQKAAYFFLSANFFTAFPFLSRPLIKAFRNLF